MADPERHREDATKAGFAATPLAVTSITPLATFAPAAASMADVSGGLIHYIASAWARNELSKVTNPLSYDLKVLKLDKEALEILAGRLSWLERHQGLIDGWRKSAARTGGLTPRGQRNGDVMAATVETYDFLMQGYKSVGRPGMPQAKADLEMFIDQRWKRRLRGQTEAEQAAEKELSRALVWLSRLYHFTKDNIEEVWGTYNKQNYYDGL